MFVAGNRLEGRDDSGDPWDLIARAEPVNRSAKPFEVAAVVTDPAARAFDRVLEGAGATAPARDAVDRRVIEQVRSGRGRVINSQDDVGGWPTYGSGTPAADEDRDGMPDAWEREHGLDPANPGDSRGDRDADGYTNLEEFLNQAAVQNPG